MLKALGGYTVIEIIIVLAVTGVLFAASIAVFQGQQGRTSFDQAIEDLVSKINAYSVQVVNSNLNINRDYTCTIAGAGVVVLSPSPNKPSLGNNEQCLVLGLDIAAATGSNNVTALATFSPSDIYNGAVDTGQPVTDISNAHPSTFPSINSLNETYPFLDNSLTIKSSTVNGGNANYGNVGIFNRINSASGNTPVSMYAYQPSNVICAGSCQLTNPVIVNTWDLCVQDSGQTVLIESSAKGGSITVEAKYQFC